MIKAAVIGVGNMGKHHARLYSEIPNVELVAVSDTSQAQGKLISQRYSSKYYSDYHQMLDKEKLDAISVCVPVNLHYQIASDCLKRKINTLLEKPITANVKQGIKLLELAKSKKVKLLVGHIERHNPAVKKVKEIVSNDQIGKVISILTKRVGGKPPNYQDTDVATDLAIHDIDICNFLLDDLPKKTMVHKQRNLLSSEDSAEFFMKYSHSAAYIQANWISPVKIRRLEVTGTEGYLELDFITQKITVYKSSYNKFDEAEKGFEDYVKQFSDPDIINISVIKKEPLKEEILFFINSINENQEIDSTFAVDALKLATAK